MVLLDSHMIDVGVMVKDTWTRYDRYCIRYIVPADDATIMTFYNSLEKGFVPGLDEFVAKGDILDKVEWFTDAGWIDRSPPGKSIIIVRAIFDWNSKRFEKREGKDNN